VIQVTYVGVDVPRITDKNPLDDPAYKRQDRWGGAYREVRMKREISLFLLLALFLLRSAVEVSAQDKSYITVTGNQLNNGVVILDVVKAGKAYRLQCNQGAPGCTTLSAGKYLMVELPENFGMYECKDVEVYPEPVVNPEKDKDKKLGEYCLIAK
jgi:hypothetical protein